MKTTLNLADVVAARCRIAAGLRFTPCMIARDAVSRSGGRIWLKRDDLQRTGSFKERGARNALLTISALARRGGVVAASAGNHALGLAFHGAQLGIPVTVVVPVSAPKVKVERCRGLGANVVIKGRTFDESQAHAVELARSTGAAVVHPFDDVTVIAGQGTIALEILEQVPDVDTIAVPVGGGGLLAGVATVVKALRPDVKVIAVEPANAAGFLAAQLCGRPTRAALEPTLADGLAVSRVGDTTFAVASRLIDDLVTVSEEEIASAVADLTTEHGTLAEGAGAAAFAAVAAGKIGGDCIVVPVTGRNIDPALHSRIVAAQFSSRPTALAPAS